MILDALAARALSSAWFTRPVVNFVHAHMDETAIEWRLTTKSVGFPQPRNFHTLPPPPPTPPSPASSSDEISRKKHQTNKPKSEVQKKKDQANLKSAYSTTSSDRDTRTMLSGHKSPLPDFWATPATKC